MKHAILQLILLVALVIPRTFAAEDSMPASSEFAIDLYRQLDIEPGNLFYSPLSVRAALAMTSAGAKGKTQEEMHSVLKMSGNDPDAAMGNLLRELEAEPKDHAEHPEAGFANRRCVWGQQNYPFNPAFVKLARIVISPKPSHWISTTRPRRGSRSMIGSRRRPTKKSPTRSHRRD